MKSMGKRADGERLARMQASPLWAGRAGEPARRPDQVTPWWRGVDTQALPKPVEAGSSPETSRPKSMAWPVD